MADNTNDTATDTNGVDTKLISIEKGVKDFLKKSEDAEASQVETKKELTAVKAELLILKEASVKKDAADKANQEALDKLIAERKSIPNYGNVGEKSFEQVLSEKLKEHEDKIVKMANKEPGREMQWEIKLDGPIDMTTKVVGDVVIANYTGGTRGLTALRPGLLMQPPRKVHVRDILATGTIGPGTEYVFMKENGAGEGVITSVAETATKPQIDVDLIEASVKIETIAGWMRVSRKAMKNIQGFTSFLQMRLPEKLLRVEDNLLLNGDGVTPNIKGIQVAGNFTAFGGAATIDIEQLIQAFAQLEGLDNEATGVVLNPADYYAIMLNKASTSGTYDLPSVVTLDPNGVLRILGVPVVRTNAQTATKFLVGDFNQGAQFLIQEGIRIEFFEQDGTNVRENKVTVRIEETVAFPVYGAEFFIFGTL